MPDLSPLLEDALLPNAILVFREYIHKWPSQTLAVKRCSRAVLSE